MRFVAIGGGHGTAVTLRALRGLDPQVTGIVSVADDGGSTGRLRALFDVAAVGDLRKCLVALADPHNPLAQAFEHRFNAGELAGHAVGNLFLVGLIEATGNLEESVDAAAEALGVRGTIVPASREGVVLVARHDEGITRGQTAVAKMSAIHTISLDPPAPALYVANLRPEEPETKDFSLQDHLDVLAEHGIHPTEVLVDAASPFAEESCTVRTRVVSLTSRNPLVHDVPKLMVAVNEACSRQTRDE